MDIYTVADICIYMCVCVSACRWLVVKALGKIHKAWILLSGVSGVVVVVKKNGLFYLLLKEDDYTQTTIIIDYWIIFSALLCVQAYVALLFIWN